MTLIKRQLQTVIQDRMFCGKAIILIGARQVGKSTLFEQILDAPQLGISNDQILPDFDTPESSG